MEDGHRVKSGTGGTRPPLFEELDYRQTPLGELILRRRETLSQEGVIVYEVKLGGEFLMSSLVNESEIALATLTLAALRDRDCDVLIGGLGLGYTARAALEFANVRSVTVVESLGAVIDWHRQNLVPLGPVLAADPRCRLVHADFFALLEDAAAFEPPDAEATVAEQRGGASGGYDAILVDIDHSPRHLLDPAHAPLYQPDGLRRIADRLRPGGAFALWSADPPEREFLDALQSVFSCVSAPEVEFYNPMIHEDDRNTIYIARPGGPGLHG